MIDPPPLTHISLNNEPNTIESHVPLYDTEEVRICFQHVNTIVILFNKSIELINI